MKVVEIDASFAETGPACRKEAVTGSRIVRETCYLPTEAEAKMNEEVARAELAAAREWAMLEEQRRQQLAMAEALRSRAMQGGRR